MRLQASRPSATLPFVIVIILFLLLSLMFAYGNSLLSEMHKDKEVDYFREESVSALEKEKILLLQKMRYLETAEYYDKWGKETGRMQEGEKVIEIDLEDNNQLEDENNNLAEIDQYRVRPKREQWKIFFFGEKTW